MTIRQGPGHAKGGSYRPLPYNRPPGGAAAAVEFGPRAPFSWEGACIMRRNRFSLIAVLVLVVGLIPALGARAKAPDINLDYQRYVLGNGLRLIVHEDHAAPIVSVAIFYHVGSKNEPTGKHGFAHLFEHLMFNGSENFNGEWFDPLQKAGATRQSTARPGSTARTISRPCRRPRSTSCCGSNPTAWAICLGASIRPSSTSSAAWSRTRSARATTSPIAAPRPITLSEGLFPPDHPYHHSTIGSVEDLDAATLDTVHQWFKDYYGPNNAVLSISGDIDAGRGARQGRALFRRHPGRSAGRSLGGLDSRPHPRHPRDGLRQRAGREGRAGLGRARPQQPRPRAPGSRRGCPRPGAEFAAHQGSGL